MSKTLRTSLNGLKPSYRKEARDGSVRKWTSKPGPRWGRKPKVAKALVQEARQQELDMRNEVLDLIAEVEIDRRAQEDAELEREGEELWALEQACIAETGMTFYEHKLAERALGI